MTVKELWFLTTYVGKLQIEDDEHYLSNPLLVLSGEETVDFMLTSELAKREVKYFDFMFGKMRIMLKGEEK